MNSHAGFAILLSCSHSDGDPRAAAGDELQSVVDVGTIRAPLVPASRSRTVGPHESQPGAYAATFTTVPAGRTCAGQKFSARAQAGLRGIREVSRTTRYLWKNRTRKRDQESHCLFFSRIRFSRIDPELLRWLGHPCR